MVSLLINFEDYSFRIASTGLNPIAFQAGYSDPIKAVIKTEIAKDQ